MSVRIELPIKLVSPNATMREHWAKKAKRRAEERGLTRAHLFAPVRQHRAELRPLGVPYGPVVVTLTRISSRDLDSDNVQGAFKSVRDGVADALGVNDNDVRVEWVYRQEKSKTSGIRIEIEVKS